MARYAIVRTADNIVANTIEWDGLTAYTVPGATLVLDALSKANIGGNYVGGVFGAAPARIAVEAAGFNETAIREYTKIFASALVAQGLVTQAKSDAILTSIMSALTR